MKEKVKVEAPALSTPSVSLCLPAIPEACLPLLKCVLIICNFVKGRKDKRTLEGSRIYI